MNPKGYFEITNNAFDFFGLISIILYFVIGNMVENKESLAPFLIFGLFMVFYRGILSVSIIYEKFMVNLRLLINSLYDLIPFLVVCISQIMLFAALDFVKLISDIHEDENQNIEG